MSIKEANAQGLNLSKLEEFQYILSYYKPHLVFLSET